MYFMFFSWLCMLVPELLCSRSISVICHALGSPELSSVSFPGVTQMPGEHLALSPPGGAIPFHSNPRGRRHIASLELLEGYIGARAVSEEHFI